MGDNRGDPMDDLRGLIRIASRRLTLSRVIVASTIAVLASMVAVLVWVAISKGVPVLTIPWWIAVGVIGIAVVVAVLMALFHRGRDDVSVAVAVDQRLGLNERFATAIQVANREDPFAVAAVADAAGTAHEPGMARRIRQAFRPEPPRGWWLTPLVALLLVFTWIFIPQGNLFASEESDTVEVAEARSESDAQLDGIIEAIEENPLLAEEMADIIDSMQEDVDGFGAEDDSQTVEDVRREAIRKASEMQERLEEMLNGENASMENALRENLEGLNAPKEGDPDAAELAEALKKGDFSAAKAALENLAKKMEEGALDPEKEKALKKQLEDLAKQLEDLAKQQKALEEQLKQAGLDPDLAKNPEALKQAIQNSQNLNEQQKQQLQKQAQAQQAACKACQGMGKACQQMAEGMGQQGQQGQQGEQGQQQMSEMLSDLEAMQQMLQQAQQAASQCQGACEGLGKGLSQWAASLPNQKKASDGGMGQWGQGQGGNAPIAPTPTASKIEKEKVEVRSGDIIARQLIEGEQVVGEAKARLRQLSNKISRGFEEGVQDEPVPPHLREVHKRYFGELQKRIDARVDSAPDAESEEKTSTSESTSESDDTSTSNSKG